MLKPAFSGEVTPEKIEDAQAQGLPVIGGKQAVAVARMSKPGQPAVNWYCLEDGSEWVADDQGNQTEWAS